LAAHSLKSSITCIWAIHLSALAKKLEMGRSDALDRNQRECREAALSADVLISPLRNWDSQTRP
ncbi:MAG TPA: hypothetical protein PLK88_05460, partial [Methanothrix sp.]|nr:hypothetical protein [Methanothrix sp.]HQJ79942.1 hypothetical protein [Methanothrix sp.]